MFDNIKMSLSCDPFDIQFHTNVCTEVFREFAQVYCLLQDMDNVQNAVNPLSDISMYTIQSTTNLSRHCIHFTPVKVYNNTSSLYPIDISSKTQVAFLIVSEY